MSNDYNVHHSTKSGDDATVGFKKAFGEKTGGCAGTIVIIVVIMIIIAIAFKGC